jgi:hypothetical protein
VPLGGRCVLPATREPHRPWYNPALGLRAEGIVLPIVSQAAIRMEQSQ